MTIKAFLKKIATEREKAQKKQSSDMAAANPVPAPIDSSERLPSSAPDTTSATPTTKQQDTLGASQEAPDVAKSPDHTRPSTDGETVPTEAQMDVPQPSIEVIPFKIVNSETC